MKRFLLATAVGISFLAACEHVADRPVEQGSFSEKAKINARILKEDTGGYYKVGTPYRVEGQWYTPHEDEGYQEEGIASWYGPNFHGKLTGNGERFDQYVISAAHRTLPMPSIVTVENLENGRSMRLRVNDRGPFAKDRIIDLSKAAAKELGFYKQGTARVRVTYEKALSDALFEDGGSYISSGGAVLPQDEALISPAATKDVAVTSLAVTSGERSEKGITPVEKYLQELENASGHFIQVGAYNSYQNAQSVASSVEHLAEVHLQEVHVGERLFFRVRLGPVISLVDADQVLKQLGNIGFDDAIIVSK